MRMLRQISDNLLERIRNEYICQELRFFFIENKSERELVKIVLPCAMQNNKGANRESARSIFNKAMSTKGWSKRVLMEAIEKDTIMFC